MPDNTTPKTCLNCGKPLGPRQKKYCSRICCNTDHGGEPPTVPPNPSGLCMCGCGQKTAIAKTNCVTYGNMAGHPVRFIKNHHFRVPEFNPAIGTRWTGDPSNRSLHVQVFRLDFPERYYEVDEATGCWNWKRAKKQDGYGCLVLNGKQLRAHRVVYTHLVGEIPEGKELDHLCRNKACVNPAHLEPVTKSENVRRAWEAKRADQS